MRAPTHRGRSASRLLAGLLLILLFPGRPHAAEVPFTVRAWGLEDGLPTSSVHHIAQTPDGYLWLSTTGGLARFDGSRFEVFGLGQGLTSNRIRGLAVAADGSLYASCEDGSLARWDSRAFTVWPTAFIWPANSLGVLPDGSVLGHSGATLWRFHDGSADTLPMGFHLSASPLTDARGRVWLRAPDGSPARLVGERLVALGPAGDPGDHWLRDLRDGGVLFLRRRGRDAELLDERLRLVTRLPEAGGDTHYLVDRQGRLWSASGTDMVLRDARDGRAIARVPVGLGDPPYHVFVDRDDNVWAGTSTQGLIRIAPSPLRLLRPPGATLPAPFVSVLESRDGRVLAIDHRFRDWLVEADGLRPYPEPGAPGEFYESGRSSFRVLAGGLELRDSTGRGGVVPQPLPWIGSIIGDPALPLTVYGGLGWELQRLSLAPGLPSRTALVRIEVPIRHLSFDLAGRLWVATTSGLWRLAPGDTQRFTRRDGLPTDHLRQVHVDGEGTVWIGTYGGGLVRFRDGRFATLDRRHGLLDDVVSTVLEDDAGNLWLGGNAGIQRISRREANDCLDGFRRRVAAVGYGRESGLRNPEGTGYPGLRSSDGRLWFLTLDGLAVVDPRLARSLTGPAPVPAIEALFAGEVAVPRGERGFVLSPGRRRFSIRYTGVHLRAAEQVRFRYRLEGFDPDWIDAGDARVATYTNVPPGRHVFRVSAISGNGVESPSPAEVVIDLRPHFWETRPFQAMVAVAALFAIGLGWRLRSRALVARAAELERAVDERTAELVDAQARTETALRTVEAQAHRLEALDRARSRFFASISHEFRTPLTLIQGPLQDVREGLHGEVRPDAREQVGIALDSATRLQRLVDQLLDAARAEAGELRLERRTGDLIGFLDELALGFAPLAERKRITFARHLPAGPAPASFDPPALEKVFANLLGNAFKFTPEGGHVTLSAAHAEDDGPALVVSVSDDGPGIAAEDLPRVFERFYRAERSVTRVQPGTGLGLALAHDMVEQHGGTIAVASREGHGSTFTVRLPLLAPDATVTLTPAAPSPDAGALAALADEIRAAPEPPPPSHAPPEGDDAATVVVVDDHPDVRAYVARVLARHYRVVEAADGAQALALMRRAAPDLVVSDVAMPVLDGLALCRAIREDPELESVPVILLTAAAASDSRVAGLEGGADDYLTKPFEVRELLARIDRLLQSRRRLRERLAREAAAAVVYGTAPPEPDGATGRAADASPGPGPGALASPFVAGRLAAEQAFVRRLHEVIESRMGDEDFDVERLAEAMGMGRTLLYQRAGEMMGRTPMELIFDHRLERAAALLAAREGGVGEIAYAVGFRSVAHFTNRFRERFGVTPSAWKRGERPVAPPSADPTAAASPFDPAPPARTDAPAEA